MLSGNGLIIFWIEVGDDFDEIVDILSGGPTIKISKTLKILNKVSPFFGSKWKNVEK